MTSQRAKNKKVRDETKLSGMTTVVLYTLWSLLWSIRCSTHTRKNVIFFLDLKNSNGLLKDLGGMKKEKQVSFVCPLIDHGQQPMTMHTEVTLLYEHISHIKSIFLFHYLDFWLSVWLLCIYLLLMGYVEWNIRSWHQFLEIVHFFQPQQLREVTHNCLYFRSRQGQGQVLSRSSRICNICHRHIWQHNQRRAKREAFYALWCSNDGLN